jgi:hypothetical protein
MGWSLAAIVVAVSGSAVLACDHDAQAADAKDASGAKAVVAKGDAKGCDMPCCAHAKQAADVKADAAQKDAMPCSGHDAKGCPKKGGATAATVAAKADPAKDAAKPQPAADSGTQR